MPPTVHLRRRAVSPLNLSIDLTEAQLRDRWGLSVRAKYVRERALCADLLIDLVAKELPQPAPLWGMYGSATECQKTFSLPRRLRGKELDSLTQLVREAIELPAVDLLIRRGPIRGELAWDHLGPESSAEELKAWAIAHYRASGINDPHSVGELLRGRFSFRWKDPATVRARSDAMAVNDAQKVQAYAELLRRGVRMPPVIAKRRGDLREGYHRLEAHLSAGIDPIGVIEF